MCANSAGRLDVLWTRVATLRPVISGGAASAGEREAQACERGDDVVDPGPGALEPDDHLAAGVNDSGCGVEDAVAEPFRFRGS